MVGKGLGEEAVAVQLAISCTAIGSAFAIREAGALQRKNQAARHGRAQAETPADGSERTWQDEFLQV